LALYEIKRNLHIYKYYSELDPTSCPRWFISVFPTETLYIEADSSDQAPYNFIQVTGNCHLDKNIEVQNKNDDMSCKK